MASNTQIQFKSVSIEAFPVGSVYLSMVSTDPKTLLGYGTWKLIGNGQMIMGTTTAADIGKTGGSMTKSVPLLAHTHTGPSHSHGLGGYFAGLCNNWPVYPYARQVDYGAADSLVAPCFDYANWQNNLTPTLSISATQASGTGNTGSTGTANATMDVTNSYIKLFIWQRTA